MKNNNIKSLIHIGFGKAGSTFIQDWFRKHPELLYEYFEGIAGFRNVTEISKSVIEGKLEKIKYFVTSDVMLSAAWNTFDWNFAQGVFELKSISGEQIRSRQTEVCKTIYEIFPRSKILVITRGYSSILKSAYSEYIKAGGHLDFKSFLINCEHILHYSLDINYLVNLYSEYFGKDNVIVMPFEFLCEDQYKFISILEGKLNLTHAEIELRKLNPALNEKEIVGLRSFSKQLLVPLTKKLPNKIAKYIYAQFYKNLGRSKPFKKFIKLFNGVFNSTSVELVFPDGYLDQFREKGTSLKANSLYNDYLESYLLNE